MSDFHSHLVAAVVQERHELLRRQAAASRLRAEARAGRRRRERHR